MGFPRCPALTRQYRIVVTNDDCYLSRGLYLLYEAVKDLGETRIYTTELPRSAVGHAISFNKPLRLYQTEYLGYKVYVTDGTPIDALHLAIGLHGFRPDLVLSGVNIGENLSLQHIYYSGTIAVALEAALYDIPAVAFSADITTHKEFTDPRLAEPVKVVARVLARYILEYGMPNGIDVISVNFPSPMSIRPCVRIARAARRRWTPWFEQRQDTRGRPYYWLHTVPVEPDPDTDVYAVMREGCIAVTPLAIDMNIDREALILKEITNSIETELQAIKL